MLSLGQLLRSDGKTDSVPGTAESIVATAAHSLARERLAAVHVFAVAPAFCVSVAAASASLNRLTATAKYSSTASIP